MDGQILRPKKETIRVEGKISYEISRQSWDMIRLKKEIINEFPELREKRSRFSYQLIFYRDYKGLEKAIRKMKREGAPLPMFLFLKKES